MARTFDGANDSIHTAAGALASMTFGTLAIVCRRNSTAYNNLMTLHTSGGTSRLGLEIESNGDGNNLQWQYDGNFVSSTFGVVNADGWVLLAMGKDTGTTTPRCHKYVYSTNTWTHQDAAGTATNSTAVTGTGTMRFGEWEGGDDLNGDIAVAAAWSGRNLTDAEVEQLAHSLQGWYAAGPDALWLFDQQATSQALADLTGGGANQSSISGTAVAGTAAPIGYGFEIPVPHSVPGVGGGSTVDLIPADLALTAVVPAPVPGSVTVPLTPAAMVLAGTALSAVPGPVAITLTPATLSLTGQAVTPAPGVVTMALTPATVALTAVAANGVPGPVTTPLTAATLTLAAGPVTPLPGVVSVALTPAGLTFAAVAVSPVGPGQLSAAVLALTAVAVTPVPGPVAVTLTPAGMTFAAVTVTPVVDAAEVSLAPVSLPTVAVPLALQPGPVAISLTPAGLTLAAVALGLPDGVIYRPDTGIVARPNSGVILRPNTGIIVRP